MLRPAMIKPQDKDIFLHTKSVLSIPGATVEDLLPGVLLSIQAGEGRGRAWRRWVRGLHLFDCHDCHCVVGMGSNRKEVITSCLAFPREKSVFSVLTLTSLFRWSTATR